MLALFGMMTTHLVTEDEYANTYQIVRSMGIVFENSQYDLKRIMEIFITGDWRVERWKRKYHISLGEYAELQQLNTLVDQLVYTAPHSSSKFNTAHVVFCAHNA